MTAYAIATSFVVALLADSHNFPACALLSRFVWNNSIESMLRLYIHFANILRVNVCVSAAGTSRSRDGLGCAETIPRCGLVHTNRGHV